MKKFLLILVLLGAVAYAAGPWVLTKAGEFLVVSDEPVEKAEAVVVLSTGVDYLPRLMEAAKLFDQGLVDLVVINGNRKTDVHRQLESQGYVRPYKWYENSVSVLTFLGVNRGNIAILDAENAYDTVSEAQLVGPELRKIGITSLMVTTSKFHTKRAKTIWNYLYDADFDIQMVAAEQDPFEEEGWWKSGRQIRQVLAEYGAWFYFWGKRLGILDNGSPA